MYKFTVIDENGQRRTGVVKIEDYHQALLYVRRNYGMVLQLEAAEKRPSAFGHYTDGQRTYFFKQLAAILRSGVTLPEGLTIISAGKDAKLQKVIKEIAVGVANGLSLQAAMTAVPEFFNELCLTLVRAGEESGELASMCLELGEYFEKKQRLQDYFGKILAYPMLVFLVGICVFFLFIFVVLPNMGTMYSSLRAPVSGSLNFMLQLHGLLLQWWPLFGVGFLLMSLGCYHWRGKILELFFHLPYIRELHSQVLELRFCKLLCLLLNGGIDILQALNSSSLVVTDRKKYLQLQQLKSALARGEDLAQILAGDEKIFSPVVRGFMMVGARTGTLTELLQDAIKIQEAEFDSNMAKLQEYLPPFLLLLVAFFIGFVVLSIMHPIFSLFEALPVYQ